MKSWKDVREKKFSVEELGAIDQEVEAELLEMDLRALREAAASFLILAVRYQPSV